MDASPKERYQGEEKLLISIDLGTTMSAVAYTHMFPGSIPQVRIVNKWPGQEEAAGDSKIPSLVAYDGGRPVAFGADALEHVGTDGVYIAKWFNLHLHPDSMKVSNEPPVHRSTTGVAPTFEILPLSAMVSLKKIYADLLGYLFDHARDFFKNNTVDGARIWTRLAQQMTVCLATPNGWKTSQQAFLREACILGGLLPERHDESRLRFVTEGEASVHYALDYTRSAQWLRKGVVFAVVDAGRLTVDSTLYKCKETTPKLILEEVCASECVQAGGVFVDRAAEHMLEIKLQGSQFGNAEYIQDILGKFEKKIKRKFDGTQASFIIKFGKDWDNDRDHGVWKGRITLTKEDVLQTFTEVVPRIVSSCSNLLSGRKVEHLLLVGGFGESPYLRRRLKETFSDKGVEIVTVDESMKKAAAEGAAIWYIKELVVACAARSTFEPVRLSREHKGYVDDDGVSRAVVASEGSVDAQFLIKMMRDLNSSIDDFAFQLLQVVPEAALTRKVSRDGLENLGKAFEHSRKILTFVNLAYKHNVTVGDFIQPFIQYALCMRLMEVVFSPWVPGMPREKSDIFHGIYTLVHQKEPQERSARWRAITYSHAWPERDDKRFCEIAASDMLSRVADCLGPLCTPDEISFDTLKSTFGETTSDLFRDAMKFQDEARVSYMSFDYTPMMTRVDEPFNPMFMETNQEVRQGSKHKASNAILPVSFGLQAWRSVVREDKTIGKEVQVALKSHVLCGTWAS